MVSAIIPTYNDSKKIVEIVDNLKQVKDISEIIVVDDGSKPEHKQIFKSLSGVKLITHVVNQGKSQAMKTGFLASKGELIMYVDADLSNMSVEYIQALIDPVKNDEFEMTIALRGGGNTEKIINELHLQFAKAISGERVLLKRWVVNNMDIFDSKGFAIESEINRRLLGDYRVAFVSLPDLKNEIKVQKHGVEGITNDIKMAFQVMQNVGIFEFLRQSKIISKLPILNPFG